MSGTCPEENRGSTNQEHGGMDMGRKIRRIMMTVLLAVFLVSTAVILYVKREYRISGELYSEAARQYTVRAEEEEVDPASQTSAPVQVDFDTLLAENSDIVGWIYCEDTPIDYPVVRGADNDYYLHRSYDGTYSASGSIFADVNNREGFVDCNTIIYGHHMKDGSMFASLSKWADQEFYEDHPVIWLLTPGQDYRIVLMSGCTTSAHADIYTIYEEPGEEFDHYVEAVLAESDFQPALHPEGTGRYVLLSTCAYVFDDARYVLFGELVPADSTGGRRIREGEGQSQEQ